MFSVFPLGYAFEAIMAFELSNLNIDFDPKGVPMGITTDGSLWLANLGLKNQIPYDIQILVIYTGCCLIISLCFLIVRYQRNIMAYCFQANTKRNQGKNTAVELRGVQHYLEANSDNISNGSLNRSGNIARTCIHAINCS